MVVAVEEVLQQQGWSGKAADVAGHEPDDSRSLCSTPSDGSGDGHSIALKLQDPTQAMLSGKRLALKLRARRMANGHPSGTGTPAALTVVLQSAERTILNTVSVPGRFWQNFEWLLPAATRRNAIDLQISLLVPDGDRQVAVSWLAIDQASDELLAAAPEPVLTADATATPPAATADGTSPMPERKRPKPKKRRRARLADGTFRGDDLTTTDTNEAWAEE